MKNIAVLGSTGSIGTQTLDVVRGHRELFHISVLAANSSDELLEQQIHEFEPELAVLSDEAAYARLKSRYTGKTQLAGGRQAFIDAAAYPAVDTVVTSMMGFAGLEPTMKALDAKKNIALANKETLVVAGEIVMRRAKEQGVSILPVDSEHCAFFQCLQGEKRETIEKLLLTCSGGPFRGRKRADLEGITPAQALNQPTWSMGAKISIDSSTLMNKGLEVIEAHHLFNMPYDKISVVVQPQSAIHSMVEFTDGSVKAHLGTTDMRIPIQFALSYPQRWEAPVKPLDFTKLGSLEFAPADTDTFRCLELARHAGGVGGTLPCVMNAANEVAVAAFLAEQGSYLGIAECVEAVMDAHEREGVQKVESLEQLQALDAWARETARKSVR